MAELSPFKPTLSVLTWNLKITNKTPPEKIVAYLKGIRWNMALLQEVSRENFCALYEEFSSEIIAGTSWIWKGRVAYNLTIVRSHRIIHKENVALPKVDPYRWLTKTFVGCLELINLWAGLPEHFQLVDIKVGEKEVRVINVHLPFASADSRIRCLEAVIEKFSDALNILGGDLNCWHTWQGSILSLLLGSKLTQVIPPNGTRRMMQHKWLYAGIFNSLEEKDITCAGAGGQQIDLVLVPLSSKNVFTLVLERFTRHAFLGSDHRPVFVEMEI